MPEISPLKTLLHRPDIWRASGLPANACGNNARDNNSYDNNSCNNNQAIGIPSGLRQLDQALHHRGWPRHGLTELLIDTPGNSEFSLFGPGFARSSGQPGLLVLVAPPYIPYAPGLLGYGIDISKLLVIRPETTADILWATEQALDSGACNHVISWLPETGIRHKHLRKLQLAAQHNRGISVLVRPFRAANQPSPAALRIAVTLQTSELQLDILKQRGGWAGQQITINRPERLARQQLSVRDLPVYNHRTRQHQRIYPGIQPLADLHVTNHNPPGVIH